MAKHALIIDDDPANINLCELILGEHGYKVASAPDMSSAQPYISDRIDLFVVDYHLPDGKGVEAVSAIRDSYPDKVICILSMDDNSDVIRESIRAGGNVYMVKPATPSVMGDMLNDIASGNVSANSQQLITQHGKRNYN